jgi:hypothetical protein
MKKPYRITIAVIMTAFFVAGTVAGAAAGLGDCLPKTCCCMKTSPQNTGHVQQSNAVPGCTGNAPCCQLEGTNQTQEYAVLSSRPELPELKSLFLVIVMGVRSASAQESNLSHPFHHDGKPKAPPVPLYLQTQTLLF